MSPDVGGSDAVLHADADPEKISQGDSGEDGGEEALILEALREEFTGDVRHTLELKNKGFVQIRFTQTLSAFVVTNPGKDYKDNLMRQQQCRRSFLTCIMVARKMDNADIVADLIVRLRVQVRSH